MTEPSDGFLSRWSRRKIETRRGEETRREEDAGASPPVPAEGARPAAPPAGAEPEITPEDLAALPKVEELTAESDVTAFLRKGVPDALKNAALRRMWSLDPAIRDYVGDARDYSYDWNVPGGVPGNGPLLPTDDPGAMLRQMFPEPPSEVASAPSAPSAGSQIREPAEPPEIGASGHESRLPAGEPSPGADEPPGRSDGKALPQAADLAGTGPSASRAPLPEAADEAVPVPPRRRHGGAKPL